MLLNLVLRNKLGSLCGYMFLMDVRFLVGGIGIVIYLKISVMFLKELLQVCVGYVLTDYSTY